MLFLLSFSVSFKNKIKIYTYIKDLNAHKSRYLSIVFKKYPLPKFSFSTKNNRNSTLYFIHSIKLPYHLKLLMRCAICRGPNLFLIYYCFASIPYIGILRIYGRNVTICNELIYFYSKHKTKF